jgi:hypothetical protein
MLSLTQKSDRKDSYIVDEMAVVNLVQKGIFFKRKATLLDMKERQANVLINE